MHVFFLFVLRDCFHTLNLSDEPHCAVDAFDLRCPEPEPVISPLSIVQNRPSIDEHGVVHDAAIFVFARLRCNPKNPLNAVNDIIQCCQELLPPSICAVKHELEAVLTESCK